MINTVLPLQMRALLRWMMASLSPFVPPPADYSAQQKTFSFAGTSGRLDCAGVERAQVVQLD